MILLESVTLNEGTIYNEGKGWRICRLGDTLVMGLIDAATASGYSKVLHIPWRRANEAIVKDVNMNGRPPEGYAKLIQIGVTPEKKPTG